MNRKTAVTNILSNVTGIDINGIEYPDSTDRLKRQRFGHRQEYTKQIVILIFMIL